MTYRINSGHLMPYDPIGRNSKTDKTVTNKTTTATNKGLAFKDILEEATKSKGIKVSSHAQQRLQQRNIILEQEDLDKLQNAIKNAEKKGAREAVLFYKDTAFVTSIRNNTIITAVDSKGAEENIFTNIDSAVIIGE